MTEILGYVGAVFIGIVLGLIGGGGSILTVPIFVYVLGIEPILATAYSLFVVGSTAFVGTIRNTLGNTIDYKTGIIFAIPTFIAVFLTRKFLIPVIPESLFFIGNFEITKSIGIMMFFALIMALAAFFMIKGRKDTSQKDQKIEYNYPLIIVESIIVGVLTGIVGAGGGFLIIPALVLLAKLPMKKAVGTSLMIIAIKSLIGFVGDVQNFDIDWAFLFSFTAFSIIGIFIGIYLNKFIGSKSLKKGFGWFVLIMAIYIILKEIL